MDIEEVVGGAVELGVYELLRQRLIREIAVPQPAAGTEWSQVVPAGAAWEILAVRYRFVASAAVANRFPMVDVKDPDGNSTERIPPGATTTASQTNELTFSPGYGDHINLGAITSGLPTPPITALSGWVVASLTVNIDVGDAYSRVFLKVREWSLDAMERNSEWLTEALR